jgi:putative ABC transport system permease protein
LIVALVAIADGFVESFGSMATRSGSDLTVMQADVADMSFSALDEDVGKKIEAIPGVSQVAGTIFSAVLMPGTPYFLVFGYDPQEHAFRHFKVVEGEKLTPRAGTGRGREIMLGRAAADSLKKRVGDTVKIYNTNYRVVGIFETGVSFEEGSGLVSLVEAQRIFTKPHQVNMYGVKLEKPENADRVRRLIADRVHGVTVSRSAEFAENTQDIQVTRAMAWGISVISILAGGIGMMNTVLMSVFERTREISVLRARLAAPVGDSTCAAGIIAAERARRRVRQPAGCWPVQADRSDSPRQPGASRVQPGALRPGVCDRVTARRHRRSVPGHSSSQSATGGGDTP